MLRCAPSVDTPATQIQIFQFAKLSDFVEFLCLVGISLKPFMTRRTHDYARPPCPTTTTTATRHGYFVNPTGSSKARANPFVWNMPGWYLNRIYTSYEKIRPHPGLDNTRVGLESKPQYRMYPYCTAQNPSHKPICVCDVTRFTHLVTSHCITTTQFHSHLEKIKDDIQYSHTGKLKASQYTHKKTESFPGAFHP